MKRLLLSVTALAILALAHSAVAQDTDFTTQWEPSEPTSEQNLESFINNPPAEMPSSDFSMSGPFDTQIVPSEQCCTDAPTDLFVPGPAIQMDFE